MSSPLTTVSPIELPWLPPPNLVALNGGTPHVNGSILVQLQFNKSLEVKDESMKLAYIRAKAQSGELCCTRQ